MAGVVPSDSGLKSYAVIGEDIRLDTGLTDEAAMLERYTAEADKFSLNASYSPAGLDVAFQRMEAIQARIQARIDADPNDTRAMHAMEVLERNQGKLNEIRNRFTQRHEEQLGDRLEAVQAKVAAMKAHGKH